MQKPAVTVMVKAARARGQRAFAPHEPPRRLNVVEKDRMDYASEVDGLAEAEIVRELKRAMPDCAILGEETGASGRGRQTFVIDPLDGTSNYLHGIPTGACRSRSWRTANRSTAWSSIRCATSCSLPARARARSQRQAHPRHRAQGPGGTMLITGFPPRERERLGPHLDCLRELMREAEDVRRTGSAALDLAYVAAAAPTRTFEAGVKPWDIAAGVLLVREPAAASPISVAPPPARWTSAA
jgi:myo-inositol-1(or 4)-monophosphatase